MGQRPDYSSSGVGVLSPQGGLKALGRSKRPARMFQALPLSQRETVLGCSTWCFMCLAETVRGAF
jgi:hypothetical protein